ncbi:MAG TPA: glycosyltransferase family 4 protein [Fimbriiglobus sp.]|nr:glycosyltransferase family 4 protein [Fimbriiglobus sp.]
MTAGVFRRLAAGGWRRVRDALRGETAETVFDIHNSRELNPVLAAHGISPPTASPAHGQAERVKRVFELRPDLREAFPFALTPHPDRRQFLEWLLIHGASDYGITPDEAVAWLFEQDAAPDHGLATTYRLRPDWQQAVPHALTPGGWPAFVRFLRSSCGLRGRWVSRARFAPQPEEDPTTPGVNVVGHFRYASGLQEAAFGVVNGLRRAGFRTSLRDLPVVFACDWRDRERYLGLEDFDTTVYVAAVNTFPTEWYPRAGLSMRPGVRRVAVWYWELEELPREWADKLGWADEVWAPTRFTADCFRKYVSAPVVPMLPGVELPPFAPRPRSHFGLPDRFTFLFSFDMASVMERKNPLGLIRAFRRAFRSDDRAHLVIKVSRGEKAPDSLTRLRSAAGDGVTVIDRVMTREDALALLGCADCYTSLHRSEGLGLGMAESMLMGKPVIATAYSGNLDFMTPDAAHLVEYRRVPIIEDLDPYPKDCHWAEPSVEHAAELMRQVYDRPDEARALGERAKLHAERVLSVEAAGRRMADRLRATAAPLPRPTRGAA